MQARAAALAVAASLFSGATASAQLVFNRTGSGARAAGMGNAFTAVSDDGTAASWNPAGLGQLRKPELSVVSTTQGKSLRNEGFRTLDDRSAFTNVRSSYAHTDLDFASLAVPVTLWSKPVTFQGAWRRLYTLNYREVVSFRREPLAPEAPPAARIDANDDLLGNIALGSLAGAVKLTQRLALGASLNLWRGAWTQDNAISETPVAGAGPPLFVTSRQANRIRGQNVSLGAMLTYPRWSVGVLHQRPLVSDLQGRASGQRSDGAPTLSGSVDGTLRFPSSVGIGGAWRHPARWTVALDLTWDNWRRAIVDTPLSGPVSLFDDLPADRTATRNTLSVNAGAEHLFSGEGFVIPLRFGAAWEPQGGRNAYTRDPVNYVMLAVGTGYNTNSVKFDAALQYRFAHYRDGATFGVTPEGPLPLAVGERDSREWRLKLSVIVRVTDTEKLRRVLAGVFGGG